MQEETEFLGHTITKDGIKTSAGLVRAITEWPRPSCIKDVLQFLGLAQFYQQYIANFADITLPLSQLLKNGASFSWDPDKEKAFMNLKAAISSTPVLRIYDPSLPTTVETDASGFAIRAVLFQRDENGFCRPVAFTSRKLQPAERNYPTHEQELLAVVHALRTWRYYLDGTHFIVYTDHAILRHFLRNQNSLAVKPAGWTCCKNTTLSSNTKKGSDNIVPDALSRRPDHRETPTTILADIDVNAIEFQLEPGLRQRLIDNYRANPRLNEVYTSCLAGKLPPGYAFHNGLLYYDRRGTTVLALPQNSDTRLTLLHDHHDAPIAGHFGFKKTHDRIRRIAYWPNMAREIQQYVASCEQCQRNKPSTSKPAGLLNPLSIPERCWSVVTMDFIGSLPLTPRGHNAITVFVDKLSKMVHFVPSIINAGGAAVARQYVEHVFRPHGMAHTIVSDRDSRFTGHFWQEVHRLWGTKLAMSTAHHPQTDGQTEVANKTLKTMLRSFIDRSQTNWDEFLFLSEFAYNDSVNLSTGYTPFFLNSGQHPHVPASFLAAPESNVPDVQSFLEAQANALIFARDALQRAQDHQMEQANKHRKDHIFKVGDFVYLKASGITLAADSNAPSAKLRPLFIGPYSLLEQHSPVSFRVEFPPLLKIHDVFHVDRFRLHHPPPEALGPRRRVPPDPVTISDAQE